MLGVHIYISGFGHNAFNHAHFFPQVNNKPKYFFKCTSPHGEGRECAHPRQRRGEVWESGEALHSNGRR